MSTEVILFAVLGILAIISAAAMLLTDNAVHSALYLIVNFGCVAVLYLLLDASFLAMVQIAVYAGAIMVLFLFVIMLLGVEQDEGDRSPRFRWLSPLVLVLSVILLITSSLAFIAGDIDEQTPSAGSPLLRVIHAAPDFPAADIYANGELIAAGLQPNEATSYREIAPGDYTLAIAVAGDQPEFALPLGTVTLTAGSAQTIVAYGEGFLPSLAVVPENLGRTENRQGRLTLFNAYTGVESVNLVDPGSDRRIDPEEELTVIAEGLASGTASAPLERRTDTVNWAFVPTDNPDAIISRLNDFKIEAGAVQLVVLSGERSSVDDTLMPVPVTVTTPALAVFGSPRAVGGALFVKYVLPFQIVGVLLLSAMVGVIVLTQRGEVKPKPGRPLRRKVSRPLTSVIASQTGQDVMVPEAVPELPEPGEQPEPAGD